jgi:hypothetical protein
MAVGLSAAAYHAVYADSSATQSGEAHQLDKVSGSDQTTPEAQLAANDKFQPSTTDVSPNSGTSAKASTGTAAASTWGKLAELACAATFYLFCAVAAQNPISSPRRTS